MPQNKHLKRYQLQWRPSFPYTEDNQTRIYVLGEKRKFVGEDVDEMIELSESLSQDPNTFSIQEILRVAYNSTLILPFNTSIALAQEYSPGVKNKLVKYETLGGNSITRFGQGIKTVGLRIKIIKAGRRWEIYEKGLEAIHYLSANPGKYYGNVYLLGYDAFADGTQTLPARYKVVIDNLEFVHRSDQNTTLNADLQMSVLRDYGNYQATKGSIWGNL